MSGLACLENDGTCIEACALVSASGGRSVGVTQANVAHVWLMVPCDWTYRYD